jgi:hypothetical protein
MMGPRTSAILATVKTTSVCLLVAAVAGLGLSTSACKRLASVFGQQEPIVDLDHQFRLESPGRGWRLLGEVEARTLVPDAVAGARLTGSGSKSQYAVVIVERYTGDLDSYVKLLIDSSALEEKKVESRETVEFQKRAAVRTTMRGSFNGLKVVFQHLVFLNRGHGYQIVSWGLDKDADATALGTAAKGFHLLDGPVRGRQRGQTVADARGPGWKLKNGVFRSAAWGLEVVPAATARLIVGAELTSMNSAAEVGLVGSQPETYLLVLPERTTGADAQVLAEKRMAQNVASMELVPDEGGFTATVAGQPVSMRRYRSKSQPFVYVQGASIHDDMMVILLGWHARSGRDDPANSPLAVSLSSIRALAPEARAALATELAALPDVQNAVGPDFSLRRGTYRDFANNITWKMPPGAFRLQVGPTARAVQPSALLVLEEAGTGIGALLMSEAADGLDGPAYHLVQTASRYEAKKSRAPKARPFSVGGNVPALTTTGPTTTAGLPMVEQMVTWVDKQKAYQLIMWGPRPAAEQVLARFADLLKGLNVTPITPTSTRGQTYSDLRMGYSYQPAELPGGAWVRQNVTPKEIAAIGTTVEWKNTLYSLAILGLFAMDSQLDEENLISRFTPSREGLSAVLSAKPTTDSLDGITGKRLSSGLLKRQGETIVVIRRDGTFFGIVMSALTGTLQASDLAAMKAGFHVLD